MSRMAALDARLARDHNWVEPLTGRVCSRVSIDRYDPLVVIWFIYDGPAARVEINAPFRIQVGPDEWQLDPSTQRVALGPILALIDRTVTSAVASEDGSLRLEFSGEAAIDVTQADGVIEPWWYDVEDMDAAVPLE